MHDRTCSMQMGVDCRVHDCKLLMRSSVNANQIFIAWNDLYRSNPEVVMLNNKCHNYMDKRLEDKSEKNISIVNGFPTQVQKLILFFNFSKLMMKFC